MANRQDKLAQLREAAHALPLKPGVYIMQDAKSKVIYVGKAKALKNRVSQYFQASAAHSEKTRAMVGQVDHFDVIIADSEFEALVLECSLIKRHQPRYNILLKDDKGYPYIRVSAEEYPRLSVVSRPAEDGARYFGPYGSRSATFGIVEALSTAFKLPTCGKTFPRDIGKERPCLNHHMGRCDGWCRPEKTGGEYRQTFTQVVRLLEGKFREVEDDLTAEMEACAQELRFERAALLRDRLHAISLLSKRQKVVAGSLSDTDVVGYYRGTAKSCFVVLHYVEGELAAKDTELVDTPPEDEGESLSAFLAQYYGDRPTMASHILLPCELEDEVPLTRLFSESCGKRVTLLTPRRGAKMDLIRLANTNAREETERATDRAARQSKLMEELGRMLRLPHPPHRIEAYDISNTGKDDMVAAMTVFLDGRPLKRDHRHFKLRDMDGPDDYAAMEQVLTRRFRRYLDGDEKFSMLPDALFIDGGAVHAGVALSVLKKMGLAIPVFGMVKDNRHRTRALVTPDGEEIGIRRDPALFALVGQIQEETHRFAIQFNRLQRKKRMQASQLDSIPGVGPKRKAALLRHFKSITAIRTASLDALSHVVDKSTAQAVLDHFSAQQKGDTPCESSQEVPEDES